ncbi:aminotransferase class IV [Carnobacterium viridans]|uniref:Branched-chain amino acid aminotransferase n=1 Tax=Carnobacterium viridans TaxID=174587 RepID=A0A1H0Z574_9LACT|nr:aminotransferase class IV [Carnobacterium viridans]UDE94793.1 aminotransferase class IV [Carnobacterium viridans]SDQ22470.1 branched-chain amino acid aminotransferase [Carnobacterium viridans]
MEQVEENFYFINDQKIPTEQNALFDELEGKNIYEVIRVQQGIPLFLEDHLERFRASAVATGLQLNDSDTVLTKRIYHLVSLNHVVNKNIKLILNATKGLLIFFTTSIYPPQDYYLNGMHTTLLKLERTDPNVKVLRTDYQKAVLAERKKQRAHEVLLVDQTDHVTEGSRSNLFIVKNNILYTSPAKNVLLGIVRKKTLELCTNLNFTVREETIAVSKLPEIDGAFITGTGNNILPINSIGELPLHSTTNSIIKTLMTEYAHLVETYIIEHQPTHL